MRRVLRIHNWGNPTTNITSGAFGRIGSQGSPRIMQFAIKYEFQGGKGKG
jgi:hypothetical protein